MFCRNCGAELSEGTKFCTKCGEPVGNAEEGQSDKAGDDTVLMPSPLPASGSTQRYAPASADKLDMASGPAAPSPVYSRASSKSGGVSAITVAMAIIAAVAVIALVVVIADPLQMRGADAPLSGQQTGTADDVLADDVLDSAPDSAGSEDDPEVTDDGASVDDDDSDSSDDAVAHVAADDYVLPDSSSHRYSADELSYLSNWELYIARNEIYARHGRTFNNDDLQRYFDAQPWYTPYYSPEDFDAQSGSILSEVERNNATTILSVERERGSEYI